MTRRLSPPRRTRGVVLGIVGIGLAATMAAPAKSAEPIPGSAGIDTSLAKTESAVTVRGRGRFADLKVTVNQTKELVNQAVSITWTGGVPTLQGVSRFDGHYLQIFQCWGDAVDEVPENPGPPPEQCVQGASNAVFGGSGASSSFPGGGFAVDRIISRRDFPNFDPAAGAFDERTGYVWRPFRAVDGTEVTTHYDPDFNPSVEGGSYWLNSFFNSITTNEIAGGRTGANGTGAELFEVTTGLESSGLGCGQHVQPVVGGSPKVPRCWLVIVPRGDPATENEGTPFTAQNGTVTSPVSPVPWRNRIAIPLEFRPIDSSCDINAEDRRIAGSELPVPAISSWQQALCAIPGRPPYSYGTVGDSSARQQLISGVPGAPGMVVVSRPIDPSRVTPGNPVVYAPVSLSAVVVGFNVERNPRLEVDPAEEALRGIRVAEINLTPRLVAKLLTQSYRQQTAIKGPTPYPWAKDNPPHLAFDPDFIQFNPEFALLQTSSAKSLGGFLMPARNSDTARQVWAWVLADPEARAWLDGNPDEFGMQVNPVYATQSAANATGEAFGAPVPDQFPKSDPYCYQAPPQGVGGAIIPPPLCGTDWLPYVQSYRDGARSVRAATDGARTSEDPFALTADKVYRVDGPQALGSRAILSITDSASAFQYGLQTARLSRAGDDGDVRRFLAPDVAAMTAAVASMTPGEVQPVLEPDPTADAPDAYPLTALTYAAVAPLSLDEPAREDYAAFLDYAAGPGQVAGLQLGELPPGYAPLTPALKEATRAGAKAVRELAAPVAGPAEPLGTEGLSSAASIIGGSGFAAVDFGSRRDPAGASIPVEIGETPIASSAPESSGGIVERLTTPFVKLAGNRFVLPGLATVALLSGLGALEITKRRPRRWPWSRPQPGNGVAP